MTDDRRERYAAALYTAMQTGDDDIAAVMAVADAEIKELTELHHAFAESALRIQEVNDAS